jgi:HAD superfamily hydrolase (TIGR01662 family)
MEKKGCLLFDWGDTLMRTFPQYAGAMKDWARVEAVRGAAEMLAGLHEEWTLALATNAADSDEEAIRAALRRAELDRWIDRIYCFKKVRARKPEREFFEFILEELDIAPGQAIMIGDDQEADIRGALRSGLKAIWFNEGTAEDMEGEGYTTVHALSEIPEALQRMRAFPNP